jgi:DNA segregation ATPase FtsK/SpoIIIE-like protein
MRRPSSFLDVFTKHRSIAQQLQLPVFLGFDNEMSPQIIDLIKAPNLAIFARSKPLKESVLKMLLSSLWYWAWPKTYKFFVLSDLGSAKAQFDILPKLDEPFESQLIRHLSTIDVLRYLKCEMDDRLTLVTNAGCRNISLYNNQSDSIDSMPYLLILIGGTDQFLPSLENELLYELRSIMAVGRVVGIHVISTSRYYKSILNEFPFGYLNILKSNSKNKMLSTHFEYEYPNASDLKGITMTCNMMEKDEFIQILNRVEK